VQIIPSSSPAIMVTEGKSVVEQLFFDPALTQITDNQRMGISDSASAMKDGFYLLLRGAATNPRTCALRYQLCKGCRRNWMRRIRIFGARNILRLLFASWMVLRWECWFTHAYLVIRPIINNGNPRKLIPVFFYFLYLVGGHYYPALFKPHRGFNGSAIVVDIFNIVQTAFCMYIN